MSEMEELLKKIAQEVHDRDSMGQGQVCVSTVYAVLEDRLLSLLEASADMRYQEWPATMTHGPAKDWDDALAAARRGGPDV